MTTLTDRSRIISYNSGCKRQRFLNYHCQNTGIVPKSLNLTLNVGIQIHDAIGQLLQLHIVLDRKVTEYEVTNVLAKVRSQFYNLVTERGLDIEQDEDQIFVLKEQLALIEALTWVWFYVQYPRLISEYEVVGVEEEIDWTLVKEKINCSRCNNTGWVKEMINFPDTSSPCPDRDMHSIIDDLIVMSRPDAILRDKSTGALVIYSLKTASTWGSYGENDESFQEKKNKYDDQGISELIAVERKYNEKVQAIKMEYLIKGQRKKLKDYTTGESVKLQNSYLIHPYMNDDGFNVSFRLEYTKAKGWKRINIWEEMEIQKWIEFLVDEHYESLEKVIATPYPYMRNEEDIEDWIQSMGYQEQEIVNKLAFLETIEPSLPGPREGTDAKYKPFLSMYFPQNREHCFQYGGMCPYVNICWEGSRTTDEDYVAREPHHETEMRLFQIKEKA